MKFFVGRHGGAQEVKELRLREMNATDHISMAASRCFWSMTVSNRIQDTRSGAAILSPMEMTSGCVRIYTEERRLHTTCLETAENVLRSFQLLMTCLNDVRYLLKTLKDPFQCFPMFVDCV